MFQALAMMACLFCSLSSDAQEAYACYIPGSAKLTFYYDNIRSYRSGTTYSLNTGYDFPEWAYDGTYVYIKWVVFDPSFANARPTTTCLWFSEMTGLQSITGMKEYLNTSEVTNMAEMFSNCGALTSIDVSAFNTFQVTDMERMFGSCSVLTSFDLSGFNTSNVTDMSNMFRNCTNLVAIYAGSEWTTDAVTSSKYMFTGCTNLVGSAGTVYSSSHTDASYAHIDEGPSNPGYFTEGLTIKPGDVNGDGDVGIGDVTTLIHYLLTGDATGVNVSAADCDQDGEVGIADVTALIHYLLTGYW